MLTPRARFQGPFSGANKGQNLADHYPVIGYQNVLILHCTMGPQFSFSVQNFIMKRLKRDKFLTKNPSKILKWHNDSIQLKKFSLPLQRFVKRVDKVICPTKEIRVLTFRAL